MLTNVLFKNRLNEGIWRDTKVIVGVVVVVRVAVVVDIAEVVSVVHIRRTLPPIAVRVVAGTRGEGAPSAQRPYFGCDR